jgi:tetratricopeptide (TPR) repeat protein
MAGRLSDAVRAYGEALRLRPDYAVAHNNLGTVLATLGDLAPAIQHFRAAAKADPANVQAHRNLAWYIATDRHLTPALITEAVAAGERAAALTEAQDANVLDALVAAYRAAGLNDKAAATADRARQLRARH